ncbi:zinc finger protein 36, C3H1 type-like 2 isoform X2 [Sinocyclocheilus anshuiensis]|uniref:zinc finger protein 36, C3H1 type-like 2 isoform X2 n=1 Tax=Sinocyclocheilus anshuiensis TaxID=1608454 RepID=UPI0007BA8AA4|nr:PREDICTED: zinc finger protein 36, C3H1 type-like 2 isoform X2 [Sinocyclocheilus anshuiensis]
MRSTVPATLEKQGVTFEATFAVSLRAAPPQAYMCGRAKQTLYCSGSALRGGRRRFAAKTQRGTHPSFSEFQTTSETSLFCSVSLAQILSQWQTKLLRIQRLQVGPQMRDHLRLSSSEETEMSATILSAFYDIDMLYKEKSLNMNAIHINSMLDKKAVGAPVTTSSSSSNNCNSYASGFFRRNSTSNMESMTNGNKYPASSYSSMKENAIMNKENKFRDRAYSESGQQLQGLQQKPGSQINSTRYKTELCRPFEENGACKYGEKCQFAHGYHELRSLSRHPKYKTEPCRTFHTIGFCPYGPRCHFIHNADERRPAPSNAKSMQGESTKSVRGESVCGYGQQHQQAAGAFRERPKLHHSLSFSGFSSHHHHHGLDSPLLESPTSRTPPPPCSNRSSCATNFYEDVLSSTRNSAFSFPGQHLKALLAPLAVHTHNGYYGNLQVNMGDGLGHLQSLQRLSESPVFDSPPSPPDSISDRESYASGSLSSSESLSGSESPSLDGGRRLPIFSRLSISDD